MNFRGVGWAKGRKGRQSTGDPSRKGLGEVAGGAGVDDADADVAEGLEEGEGLGGRGDGMAKMVCVCRRGWTLL